MVTMGALDIEGQKLIFHLNIFPAPLYTYSFNGQRIQQVTFITLLVFMDVTIIL